MTLQLFIEPADVWLFRDGRPFNRGSDHRAQSVFPPLPSVLQGVIRSHYIALNGGIEAYLRRSLPDVEQVIGKPGCPAPATFQLRGPLITKREKGQLMRYIPLPYDLYRRDKQYEYLKPQIKPQVMTDLDTKYQLLWHAEDFELEKADQDETWLDEQGLLAYLEGKPISASHVVKSDKLFHREPRIGIERDDMTRATRERMLYETEFIRPCENVGLYVEVDGLPDIGWQTTGVISMGGEGRFGRYERGVWSPLPQGLPSAKCKACLLTPTYFTGGWQPQDWGQFFKGAPRCIAAAVNKPLMLGGYDLAQRQHKPAYRYAPGGSVYFLENAGECKAKTLCESFNGDGNVSTGFGQFILAKGEW
ncbi:MAG: type III-B CRISPR module-associated protein Cmr3 [Anaerolineae bacterium]|nr:type III-B CRISPR module-associated protein Cmr3 [Anaerolineae bacterium]